MTVLHHTSKLVGKKGKKIIEQAPQVGENKPGRKVKIHRAGFA